MKMYHQRYKLVAIRVLSFGEYGAENKCEIFFESYGLSRAKDILYRRAGEVEILVQTDLGELRWRAVDHINLHSDDAENPSLSAMCECDIFYVSGWASRETRMTEKAKIEAIT